MRKRYLYFCAVLTIVVLGIQGCGSNSNPTSTTNNGPSPYSSGALTVVSSGIDQPYGITFDSFSGSGDIWFVANSNPGTIYGYTTAGAAVTSAYYYTGTSSYDYPIQVCTDPNGYIYVADQINNQVEVLTSTGAYDNVISGLNRPSAVAVNSAGTTLYVVNDTSPVAFLTYSITGASYPKTYTSKANSFPTGGATYDPSRCYLHGFGCRAEMFTRMISIHSRNSQIRSHRRQSGDFYTSRHIWPWGIGL